jgi:hypothetical protein
MNHLIYCRWRCCFIATFSIVSNANQYFWCRKFFCRGSSWIWWYISSNLMLQEHIMCVYFLIITFVYVFQYIVGGRSQVSSSPNIRLASRTTTPHISPPGSPPIVSASVTPTRTSKPASPSRRHAVSLQIDRSSMFSSTGSMSSVGAGSHTGEYLYASSSSLFDCFNFIGSL